MSYKNKNEVEVYFSLKGDFDPDLISMKLDIEPTRKNKKGDKGQYSQRLNFSLWEFSSGKISDESVDIYEISSDLVENLSTKVKTINKIIDEYQLISTLQTVICLAPDEDASTPVLGFNLDVIKFLYQTKTAIDVDIYRTIVNEGKMTFF